MFKKWVSAALAGMLAVTGVAACSGNIESADTEQGKTDAADQGADVQGTDQEEWDEDPAEINWYIWNAGGTCNEAGIAAVEEAVNEITLKKVNVRVNLEVLEMGAYLSQMPMQVSAGDKIDLITTFPSASCTYTTMVNNGQLLPLNELLEENAGELLETVPESLFQATTVDGNIYAVPVYTDQTNDLYWICRSSNSRVLPTEIIIYMCL